MVETRDTVSQWAEATFGPAGSDARVWARANEEMAELLRLLTFAEAPDPDAVAEECADVAICLYRLAARKDWPVEAACPAKSETRDALWYAGRANAKMASLMLWLGGERRDTFGHWLVADVLGELTMASYLLGRNLPAAINRKMFKNRRRTWKMDGSGCAYHVKDEAACSAPGWGREKS